jgi:hypothetical protein
MVVSDNSADAPLTSGKTFPGLASQLDKIIDDAGQRATSMRFYVKLWQRVDITFGLLVTTLAAAAGVAGLASTAGRVPAAIVALCAAGFAAANKFLDSGKRFQKNRKRMNAWDALKWDADAKRAKLCESSAGSIEDVVSELLRRRIAILNMDHDAIPPDALGDSVLPSVNAR